MRFPNGVRPPGKWRLPERPSVLGGICETAVNEFYKKGCQVLASWVTSCTTIFQSTTFFLPYIPCSFLNAPPRLSTNRGDSYLYMPYWISTCPNTGSTTNMAVFWTSFPLHSEGGE